MVIAGLVSNTQSAFVAGRQILDGPFILNEVLDWCKRKKKKALFFKVDFAKAYDSVRWDFLLDVLEAFGFGSTWCTWIRGISDFAKASLLVNGSPSDEFHIHRGLKQGELNEELFQGIQSTEDFGLIYYIPKSQIWVCGGSRSRVVKWLSSLGCTIRKQVPLSWGYGGRPGNTRHKAWMILFALDFLPKICGGAKTAGPLVVGRSISTLAFVLRMDEEVLYYRLPGSIKEVFIEGSLRTLLCVFILGFRIVLH
ncbi:RNA-directed DNA polymerase, eukaryota [Tanacetum coccineum]